MTDLYPLSAEVRDRIDFSLIGEEPHALEEGTWTFLIGPANGLKRWFQIVGLYGSAAERVVEAAEEGDYVWLVGCGTRK